MDKEVTLEGRGIAHRDHIKADAQDYNEFLLVAENKLPRKLHRFQNFL